MYRKEEIFIVTAPVHFLKYGVVADANITIFTYNYSNQQDLTQLERVYTLSVSLFSNQFSLEDDRSAIYLSPSLIGSYIRVAYYSDGGQNPYYASSNLANFIEQVLRWTSNRIVDGLFLYSDCCGTDINKLKIQPGSFVYDGQYYTYKGGEFALREHAPPMIKLTYKSYLLYISQEILQSFLDKQMRLLNRVGIINSATAHESITDAKADVDAVFLNYNDSQPLSIAYIHAMLTDELTYLTWIEYPTNCRTL